MIVTPVIKEASLASAAGTKNRGDYQAINLIAQPPIIITPQKLRLLQY
jgi:hypothetical protein